MELKVIEQTKNKVIFEVKEASHGLCNAVVKELWHDSKVKAAAYNVDHPLVGVPTIIVEVTQGNEPKKAIQDAIKRLIKNSDKFKKEFSDKVKR